MLCRVVLVVEVVASAEGGTNYVGGAGTAGQGFAGGTTTGGTWQTSGGGGATQPGAAGVEAQAGNGGSGVTTSLTGTAIQVAGGGGGSRHNATTNHGAASHGGGAGALVTATNGTTYTGGGGGGAGGDWANDSVGGHGGTGTVVLSWGAVLQVTQSPVATRPGRSFVNEIKVQLTDLSGNRISTTGNVSVTASAGRSAVQWHNSYAVLHRKRGKRHRNFHRPRFYQQRHNSSDSRLHHRRCNCNFFSGEPWSVPGQRKHNYWCDHPGSIC